MKKKIVIALLTVGLLSQSALWAKSKALQGVVNLNTATVQELMLLPGIGQAKAEAIVTYRQAHPFKDTSELTEIKGIGPKLFDKMKSYLTLSGPTTIQEVAADPSKKVSSVQ